MERLCVLVKELPLNTVFCKLDFATSTRPMFVCLTSYMSWPRSAVAQNTSYVGLAVPAHVVLWGWESELRFEMLL